MLEVEEKVESEEKEPQPEPKVEPSPPKVETTLAQQQYVSGTAYQYDKDDPVRSAYDHADKNLKLRGYSPNTDAGLKRELVDYDSDDPTQPPQLATLFNPHRVPVFGNFYRVHDWNWATPPQPGKRAGPSTKWPVSALSMQTTPGETLHVPTSGYDTGGGMAVIAGQLPAIGSDIGHYRVIKGYDDVAREFISDDPLQSQGSDFRISYATFARLSTSAIIPVYPPEMDPLLQSLMQDFRAREITYCPP